MSPGPPTPGTPCRVRGPWCLSCTWRDGVAVGQVHRATHGVAGRAIHRDVAQLGSAAALGAEGRRFDSCHPDQRQPGKRIPDFPSERITVKSTVEQLNPTRVKVTVEVPFAELEPDFDKAYKSLAGQVNIPGFRPGKAPAKLLEARIGRPAVLEQVVNDMIPARYSEAVDEHELKVLAQPEIEVTKIEDGDVVEFTAEVDVRPEITLPTFSELSVTVETPATDDDAVATELDNLRARFGTLKGVERGAQTGDFLSVVLAATVDGEPIDEASTEGLSYELGSGTLVEGLDDAAVGLKAGESKEFTSSLVAGDHAGKEAAITVTVQSVKERELPEADDEFAQMASEFDTLEELRADLEKKVAEQSRAGLAGEIRDKVLEVLLDATEVPAPEAVVDSEAHAQMHQLLDQF